MQSDEPVKTSFETGSSTAADGLAAGREAAELARERLSADRVDFCQVFADAAYDTGRVAGAVREVVGPDAALVGCSASGTFTDRGTMDRGVAVGVVASDSLRFDTAMAGGLAENVQGTVREVVRELPDDVDYPCRSALVLHDGLAGVGERLSLAMQRRLGPHVGFAGGAASDDYEMESTPVFCGDTVAEDALVVVAVAGEQQAVISVDHGHEPISEPMTVTDAAGPVVATLDGKPAFEQWKDAVRDNARATLGVDVDALDPDSEQLYTLMGAYEFGIDQGDGYKIRWPRMSVDADGSLQFAVEIPEGTVLRVMEGTPAEQIESAARAARGAVEHGGGDLAGGFVYDCACREIILQDAFPDAVEAIDAELDRPFAGFETYGELAMEYGQLSGFHNTTSVLFLLPG